MRISELKKNYLSFEAKESAFLCLVFCALVPVEVLAALHDAFYAVLFENAAAKFRLEWFKFWS